MIKLTKHIQYSLSLIMVIQLILFIMVQTIAQTNKTDSLQQLLESNEIHDTTRIKVLNALAWQFRNSNPDTAITLSTQALELTNDAIAQSDGIDNTWLILQVHSFHQLGTFNRHKGSNDTALTFYNHALDILNRLNEILPSSPIALGQVGEVRRWLSATLGSIGSVYRLQGDYTNALDHYHRALEISKELGNKSGIATKLGNIGLVYWTQGDYANALDHYFQALEIDKELGNKNGVARHLGNIGIIYWNHGDYANALDHYFQALEIHKELGIKRGVSRHLGNIGGVYHEQGNYAKALDNFLKALEINKELGNKNGMIIWLGNIGSVYAQLGVLEKDPHRHDSLNTLAMEHYQESIQIAVEIGRKRTMAIIRTSIASLFIKQHNPLRALSLADTAIALLTEMHELFYLEDAHRIRSLADSAMAFVDLKVYRFDDFLNNDEYNKLRKVLRNKAQTKAWWLKRACDDFLLHIEYKDTVTGTEMQEAVGRTAKMWEIRAVEKERKAKEKEEARLIAAETAKRHRLQYNIIIAIATVALALAFIVLRYYVRRLPPLVIRYMPLFIPLVIIETLLLLGEPYIVQYLGDAPLWKALIYFGIALIFLPLQRLLERIVKPTTPASRNAGPMSTGHRPPKGDFEGGGSPFRGLGGEGGSSSITGFLNRGKNNPKGIGSMFTILLAIAIINACGYNKNNSQKNDSITTNDVAPPLHVRVERGLGGEVNQAKLDSFTVIMLSHKSNFEKQYNTAQKTGSSEDYKIAYTLLKPWARWKDSVNLHTQAIKTGQAKAESKHKLEKFVQKLREEEQQRIEAERKKMRDIGHYSGIIVLIIALVGVILYFSRAEVKPRTAELLLLLTFYMLFETLLVYSDTLIDTYIGNEPIYKIISNLLLAGILTVTHEFAEKKMKRILFSVKLKRKRVEGK